MSTVDLIRYRMTATDPWHRIMLASALLDALRRQGRTPCPLIPPGARHAAPLTAP